MANIHTNTYDDYAAEAESASRAGAWPQGCALYRRAAEACPDAAKAAQYGNRAQACEQEVAVNSTLATIAQRMLGIPTLDARRSDRFDFHEVGVWTIREALRQAYQAGLNASRA